MAGQNLRSQGLSRRLALAVAAFVLLSSLALAAWMKAWNTRQELEAFKELATNNAAFVSQMRLPRSPELAQRLATVLDMGVGFHFANGGESNWPDGLDKAIGELAQAGQPIARQSGRYRIATAPLEEPGVHLVLVRQTGESGEDFSAGVLVPALGLAFVCGALGLFLGKRVVQSERLATLGRVATSLAHEIKNPAAAIRLHADLLGQDAKAGQQESVGMIREEVDNISSLVNQWLYVAKASPGKVERHNLCKLVETEVQRLRPLLAHAKVEAHVEPYGGEAWVEVDAERLGQVLRNLLVNAVQAMPVGGTVRATARAEGTEVHLRIADDGPGFSEAALQRFGEAFYTEKEGGMGLGLTLVKEVLEAHGGSVHPENPAEGGAAVVCKLPIAQG